MKNNKSIKLVTEDGNPVALTVINLKENTLPEFVLFNRRIFILKTILKEGEITTYIEKPCLDLGETITKSSNNY